MGRYGGYVTTANFHLGPKRNLRRGDCESDIPASGGAQYTGERKIEAAQLRLRGIFFLTRRTLRVDAGLQVLRHPVVGMPDGVHKPGLLGEKQ